MIQKTHFLRVKKQGGEELVMRDSEDEFFSLVLKTVQKYVWNGNVTCLCTKQCSVTYTVQVTHTAASQGK
jgi:hypothetical protein